MPSKSVLIIQKKTPGPAGFSGGTPVSISLILDGVYGQNIFTKKLKNRKVVENRKIHPTSLLKGTTAGDVSEDGNFTLARGRSRHFGGYF